MDNESTLAMIQASAFYEQFFSSPSPAPEIFLHDEHRMSVSRRPQSPEMGSGIDQKDFTMSNCSSDSSPTEGLGFQVQPAYNLYAEGHSVIGLKPEFCNLVRHGSLLNFEVNTNVMPSKEDEYNGWMSSPKCFPTLTETSSRHHAAVPMNERENVINKGIQEMGRPETGKNKRPAVGDGVQESKRHCNVSSTKPKSSKSAESTAKRDPLSIAAKNRRERISERLKALQELVPNGSKVDLVTMLEKAISYVKFLQLQVKVLATDELWPSQGGKAPELSQVKEAIDAILRS